MKQNPKRLPESNRYRRMQQEVCFSLGEGKRCPQLKSLEDKMNKIRIREVTRNRKEQFLLH